MFVDIGVRDFIMSSSNFTESEIKNYREKNSRNFDGHGLEEYLIGQNNYLEVEKITEDFFPVVNADVFISHAHQDEKEVIKLAISLERIGLSVFVDSCVWGWANHILKRIDNAYCRQLNGHYNYDSRNRTTANIYMILNCALQNTIAHSELLLFLRTDNSLKMNVVCENDTHIASPWIFSELSFAKNCLRSSRRKTGPALESLSGNEQRAANDSADVKFAYPNPGTRFEIQNDNFQSWLNAPSLVHGKESRLDALTHLDEFYHQCGVPEFLLKESRSVLPLNHHDKVKAF